MRDDFVQIYGDDFVVNGKPILLRGYALGSWMNLEHFMVGMPGTNEMIIQAFAEVYGDENAEIFFDTFREVFVQDEDIAFLKGMGTNSVRIPFGYHHFIDDRNPDVFLEKGFDALGRVVKLCEKHGIYVILDLHSSPGAQNNDWHSDNITGQSLFWKYRCFQDQVVELWRELARRYRDNPWIAGYDVLNEPTYGLTKEEFNGFYDRVTSAIREQDRDHILFLEGDDFGRSFELFDPPTDSQITYAIHYYPFVLEDDILDPQLDDKRRMEIFEEIFYRQLRARERFHRPIWCGESGYPILEGQEEFYAKLITTNIHLCELNNISWSLWTYKDARSMGIVIPREDSDWIRLRRSIEKVWSHDSKKGLSESAMSAQIMDHIVNTYYKSLDPSVWYDLEFRMRSILHRMNVENVLKPHLREIPWETVKRLPQSFSFANCDHRQVVIDSVGRYIRDHDGSLHM